MKKMNMKMEHRGLVINTQKKKGESYAFNQAKARHIYDGGDFGAIVYYGELKGKYLVYDLDGGCVQWQKALGKKVRLAENDDYTYINPISEFVTEETGLEMTGIIENETMEFTELLDEEEYEREQEDN